MSCSDRDHHAIMRNNLQSTALIADLVPPEGHSLKSAVFPPEFRNVILTDQTLDHLSVVVLDARHQPLGGSMPAGNLLYYALVALVIALIAAFLGFGGIAGTAAGIAQILFYVFLIIFLVVVIMNFMGRRRGPLP